MKFEVTLEAELYDVNGKLTSKRTYKCHSYVRQMIDLLAVQMTQNTVSMVKTDASTVNVGPNTNAFNVATVAGTTASGIVVGTGTAAVTIDDSALGAIILSGTAAASLEYQAVTTLAPATTSTTRRFSILRSFLNSTAATITISEVGLYVAASAAIFVCIERNLPAGSIAVAPNATAALTYRIKTTI